MAALPQPPGLLRLAHLLPCTICKKNARLLTGMRHVFYNQAMDRLAEVQELLNDLKSSTDTKKSCALHNRVTSVLIHDRWYTREQQAKVVAAAKASFGLTSKQKKLNLPDVRDEYAGGYNDEGYNYEGHDNYGSYD